MSYSQVVREKFSGKSEVEISLVVPVWNDATAIEKFIAKIIPILESVTKNYEVIFAADPSPDDTKSVILSAAKKSKKIKAIFMASRAGQPASSLAGISISKGLAVIVMDVDGQDPPELIPELIRFWRKGHNLVIPRRISRTGEPWSKRLTAALGYEFLKRFAHTPIPKNTGDYRLMDRSVVDRLLEFPESHIFLRGMVAQVAHSPTFVDFERPARKDGETKYNKWFGGIRSGLNGIVSFSSALLDGIMLIGFALAAISFILGLRLIIFKFRGGYVADGNASLFAVVTFVGGMNLIAIGVVGLYVGRIFEEVKRRPRWMIESAVGIEGLPDASKSRGLGR